MNCIICSEDITNNLVYLNCNCKYVYHNSCISSWLNTSKTCPTCRRDFNKKEDIKINREDYLRELNDALFYDSIGRWSTFVNRHIR